MSTSSIDVYLDHAGAGRPSTDQLNAIFDDMRRWQLANPHSNHQSSRFTSDLIEKSRLRTLEYLNTNASNYRVIFTANATAGLHLLAECFDFGVDQSSSSSIVAHKHRLPKRTFAHLSDSHTSVVGMRQLVVDRCSNIASIHADQLAALIDGKQQDDAQMTTDDSASLFVLTAESNFCGRKYPLQWIDAIKNGCLGSDNWYVCLDAASLIATANLDLSRWHPDFVVFSYYKLFGYPTGVGALLVRVDSVHRLKQRYFGGGTISIASEHMHIPRMDISQRFENGTVDYYGIAALTRGFDDISAYGGIDHICQHTYRLARRAFNQLQIGRHHNGQPISIIYCQRSSSSTTEYPSIELQGAIVNFNLLRDDGSYIGFVEVEKMCDLFGIELRTGCFCNLGACQHYLHIDDVTLLSNHQQRGKVCGDSIDLIDSRPVGSLRISFGRQSTESDIDRLMQMINSCFVNNSIMMMTSTNIEVNNNNNLSSAILTDIRLYPIKSCAPLKVDSWQMTSRGLVHDRRWAIQSSRDRILLTQKRCPRLCLLQVNIDHRQQQLQLSAPELIDTSISIEIDQDDNHGHDRQVVCTDSVSVMDCGDQVGKWIDEAIDRINCRLVRYLSSETITDDRPNLNNVAPYLLVNRASVRQLAASIDMHEDEMIDRFRANLIVDNCEPFVENQCTHVQIGNSHYFKVVGKCTRCQMICIDQQSGDKDPNVYLTLRTHTPIDQSTTFGIYLMIDPDINTESTSVLHVGSKVVLFTKKDK